MSKYWVFSAAFGGFSKVVPFAFFRPLESPYMSKSGVNVIFSKSSYYMSKSTGTKVSPSSLLPKPHLKQKKLTFLFLTRSRPWACSKHGELVYGVSATSTDLHNTLLSSKVDNIMVTNPIWGPPRGELDWGNTRHDKQWNSENHQKLTYVMLGFSQSNPLINLIRHLINPV